MVLPDFHGGTFLEKRTKNQIDGSVVQMLVRSPLIVWGHWGELSLRMLYWLEFPETVPPDRYIGSEGYAQLP